jgi:hypothetical protein
VIRDLIPYELGGLVDFDFTAEGVCCTIELAIEGDSDLSAIHHIREPAIG